MQTSSRDSIQKGLEIGLQGEGCAVDRTREGKEETSGLVSLATYGLVR